MPTSIISRADAEALIQSQLVDAIQQDAPKSSIFMQLARKLPNMSSNKTRMRVLDMTDRGELWRAIGWLIGSMAIPA